MTCWTPTVIDWPAATSLRPSCWRSAPPLLSWTLPGWWWWKVYWPPRKVLARAAAPGGQPVKGAPAASAAGSSQAQSSDPRDQLEQAVSGIPETTLLIFVDGPVSESNSILQTLKPLAQVQNLQAPAGESLARWIKTAAQEKGASLSPPAIANLVDQVGNDLRTLDQELEKLSLYCWGRTVEESDVTALVSHAREANIFAAVDAMVEGRQGQALNLLQQLRQDGRDPSYIIAMVERQLRLLALARDAIDQRLDQRALVEQLGSTSQFVIRKTMDQARKHTWSDITWRYQQLLETDLSIKQGRLDPDVALAMLVAGPADQA